MPPPGPAIGLRAARTSLRGGSRTSITPATISAPPRTRIGLGISPSTTPVLHTDFIDQVALLTVFAERMRASGEGTLVAPPLSQGSWCAVPTNVYGSAKAGLDGFASGLADALHGRGVHLIIARPGWQLRTMLFVARFVPRALWRRMPRWGRLPAKLSRRSRSPTVCT